MTLEFSVQCSIGERNLVEDIMRQITQIKLDLISQLTPSPFTSPVLPEDIIGSSFIDLFGRVIDSKKTTVL